MGLLNIKRGSNTALVATNPILDSGEPVFNTTTKELKIGDGVTAYNSLVGYALEALSDSKLYSRKNKTWVEVTSQTVKHIYAQRGLTANQSIPNNSTTLINWTSDIFNSSTFWSSGTPSRIIIPAGVTLVKVTASVRLDNLRHDRNHTINLLLNDTIISSKIYNWSTAAKTMDFDVFSRVLPVTTGNYFKVSVLQNTGAARNALILNSYIQVEVLG